jgi:3D (Asp-Asp-Asp) domain-containing protein
MKNIFTNTIRIVVCVSVFTVLELALPLHAFALTKQPQDFLRASRNPMFARLATSKPKPVVEKPKPRSPQYQTVKQVRMVVTAYSSTVDQCGGDPFVTASGTRVQSGTFAVNGLPFGTKLRIPDYFGDKIFVVQDRMSSRYGRTRGDIWMPTRHDAIQWGARSVKVEIVQEAAG